MTADRVPDDESRLELEVIGNAGFVVEAEASELADTLDRALDGERPTQKPTERAARYDWDSVAK